MLTGNDIHCSSNYRVKRSIMKNNNLTFVLDIHKENLHHISIAIYVKLFMVIPFTNNL